jgi:hypothetical protein
MDELITLKGDPQHPTESPEIGYMRFVSEKGQQGRASFVKGPLYFGENTW